MDSTFSITHKIISEEKRRKYKILIGSNISDDDSYRIFLTNKDKSSFSSIQFSFKNGTTSSKEFKLKIGEKIIQTLNYNNEFYLISGSKLTNRLYIHTFDKDGNSKRKPINTTELQFINSDSENINLLSLLIKYDNIKKFEENTPNSIELTSDQRKMYVRNGSVLFTFDHHKIFTQVLHLDLNTLKATSFQFKKPALSKKAKRSNSYLNGEHLFTIAATSEKFTVEILDFKTESSPKSIS
jgi:hypothetical protein